MKRLPSLLLSLVLSLALLVPVFAADACKEIRYTDFTCGKEMHFTEHYCRNGDKTIRVESADQTDLLQTYRAAFLIHIFLKRQ